METAETIEREAEETIEEGSAAVEDEESSASAEDEISEDDEEEIYEKKPRLNFVFVSAFTGGALGSLIISLIFALV